MRHAAIGQKRRDATMIPSERIWRALSYCQTHEKTIGMTYIEVDQSHFQTTSEQNDRATPTADVFNRARALSRFGMREFLTFESY